MKKYIKYIIFITIALLALIILGSYYCFVCKDISCLCHQVSFNSETWLQHSGFEADCSRGIMVDDLQNNILVGKNKQEILELLGKSQDEIKIDDNLSCLHYFIGVCSFKTAIKAEYDRLAVCFDNKSNFVKSYIINY